MSDRPDPQISPQTGGDAGDATRRAGDTGVIASLRLPGARIEPLRPADRAFYLALHAEPSSMAHIASPLGAAAASRSFEAALCGNACGWPSRWTWTVTRRGDEHPGGILGLVAGSGPAGRLSAESGAIFLPAARGQAYVGLSMLAVMAHAFGVMDLERLTAGHLASNQVANAIAEKLGFQRAADEDHGSVLRWRVERAQWLAWRQRKRLRRGAEALWWTPAMQGRTS